MAIRATPTGPKAPPRAVCDAIVRRYLKTDQNIDWRREMPAFYVLFKRYPSLAFWERHELPFGMNTLNHMSWFDSVEGQDHLVSAWVVFHYEPPAPVAELSSAVTVDTAPQLAYNPPTLPPARPRTVAEFLTP